MTDIRPLTRSTIRPLLDLEVTADQSGFVAPNAVTMAQALFEPGSEIFGLWEGETPVGLLAIVDMQHPEAELDEGDDPDGIYVWRLMVAAGRQGQGHGRAAMEFALGLARERGRAHVALSAVDAPGGAIPFYAACGFRPTGRIVDGEVEMALWFD